MAIILDGQIPRGVFDPRAPVQNRGSKFLYRLAAETLAASGAALGMVVTRAPVPWVAPEAAACA